MVSRAVPGGGPKSQERKHPDFPNHRPGPLLLHVMMSPRSIAQHNRPLTHARRSTWNLVDQGKTAPEIGHFVFKQPPEVQE